MNLARFVITLLSFNSLATMMNLAAFAQEVEIPAKLEVTTKAGETAVIYGQRARDCKSVPSFEWTISNAITREPKHGTLSDGGVGKRRSRSCGKVVPVRAISYTPEAGFEGTDLVTFWERETVIIEVEP